MSETLNVTLVTFLGYIDYSAAFYNTQRTVNFIKK